MYFLEILTICRVDKPNDSAHKLYSIAQTEPEYLEHPAVDGANY